VRFQEGITLNLLDDCKIDINDSVNLKIWVEGLIYNKTKNEFLYNLKTIITLV
jgi:hypothetical protein